MKTVQLFTAVCCLSALALTGCSDKQCSTYTTQATCYNAKYNSTQCAWTAKTSATCSGTGRTAPNTGACTLVGSYCCAAATCASATANDAGCTLTAGTGTCG